MGGELEGAADIATGAIIARAVEPDTGQAGHFVENACLNCGTALTGSYCHKCGQQGHLHRTLTAFSHDLLHGVLHFEGKIWRTLPMLALKPGELTRRYVHGERAKFVSPLALFLFTVFFMFALFSFMGTGLQTPNLNAPGNEEISKEVAQSKAGLQKELDAIDAKIAAAEEDGTTTAALRRERANVSGMLRLVGGGPSVLSDNSDKLLGFKTGWTRLDKGIQKANENPNLLLYKLQTNAYKFSWMLIPISVPFVWMLFFWRFDLKMYDHAIFVTYSLAFMTLLATLATIFSTFGNISTTLAFLLFLVPPIHIYKQLKGAYGLSRFGAFVRTFLLTISATIVIALFVLLLVGMGLVG